MAEKNKGGAGKFILGAALGAIAGAIAGKFVSKKMEENEDFDEDVFEHEDDGCGGDAQGLRVVALAEKLGHGRRLQAMRHLTSARTEHPPSQKRADDCVADARPCG